MRKFNHFIIVTLLALVFSACGGQSGEQAEMAASEEPMEEAQEMYTGPNAALVAEFDASAEMLLGELEGLTVDQWNFRESDERWSIAEVTEHIVMGEQAFSGSFIPQLIAGGPNAENAGGYEEMDAGVLAFIRDRSAPIQTSEAMEPTGAYATPEEGIAAFNEARAKTLEFLKTTDVDLREYKGTINPEIDPMDAYQWMLFAAGHVERHVDQIKQVKADEDYPSAA